MKKEEKKHATLLGGRIGLTFLFASGILVFVAYFVLSSNFKKLLIDYTIQLVQAMVEQGVTTVEYELRISQEEAAAIADDFSLPEEAGLAITFPETDAESDILRIVYVSEDNIYASDGRKYITDIRKRQDIIDAFNGKKAIYGPYYNEENEFVICYSSPIQKGGSVNGVLSVEKNGYSFSALIKNIRFINSGESYIINSEGTDIAVSNLDHIDWVKDQYNSKRLLEQQEDPVTRSIMELEEKGLSGQTGVGTYEWAGSLCYVAYAPIPSVNWVLLAGLRQEEIDTMTQSVLYTSITQGPALTMSVIIFLILTGIIVFWIISSMKKSAEINERLNIMANYDSLTGIMNRNSFNNALVNLSKSSYRSFACIYIDVNGLHEINNHLGHPAGDTMLKAVADTLSHTFSQCSAYRIGGDEFVVLCPNIEEHILLCQIDAARQSLKKQDYEISVGIEWRQNDFNIEAIVNKAEESMIQDKRLYYKQNGKDRQLRTLDRELEKMVLEKQDADTFLSVLAPEFKGVYFVDLGRDTIRHLFIPPYFEEMLTESDDIFSKALKLYTKHLVCEQYQQTFESFCNYKTIKKLLGNEITPEFTYKKADGTWTRLQILKFKTYTEQCQETLWIFSNTATPKEV